jgi:hypothetical protein
VLNLLGQLLCLPLAEILVRVLVVPHDHGLLLINESAICFLRVLPHHIFDILDPTQIRLLQQALPLRLLNALLVVEALLSSNPQVFTLFKPFLNYFFRLVTYYNHVRFFR